jgi:hypothetical protein
MNFPHTDGFFCVGETYGFLPIKDPLSKLPDRYQNIQSIIDELPKLIEHGDILEKMVTNLSNNIELVSDETDIMVIQALYRAYTFIT